MLFIKKRLFLITFFFYFYYCLVYLSVSRSGPSVYCFSVCQVYLSVWSVCQSFLFIIRLSVFSVCMYEWSVCLSCLSVSLFCLSFFVSVGLGGLSVCSLCLSGLFGLFFLPCFSFSPVFDGCFVCLSFWSVNPSVCLSISLYLYKIRLNSACWYLAIQYVFLSGLSVFVVFLYRLSVSQSDPSFCPSVYFSGLSMSLFVNLLGLWVSLSVWSLSLSFLSILLVGLVFLSGLSLCLVWSPERLGDI